MKSAYPGEELFFEFSRLFSFPPESQFEATQGWKLNERFGSWSLLFGTSPPPFYKT
jgi:hypothetical protein